ncbi:DUF7448 domain-containing protein [Hungatella hathewayi]|uniref:DUF7448 domain-containing protein n=1 Tax=Hungatella hathewayi TaxID=154046 RepID=UPI0035690177
MDIQILLGKTMLHIEKIGDVELYFSCSDGTRYRMFSDENGNGNDIKVYIEDIGGELESLIGNPIIMAEMVTNKDDLPAQGYDDKERYLWTYYKLATIKGYVTIRWFGTSNGYYCEKAEFEQIE